MSKFFATIFILFFNFQVIASQHLDVKFKNLNNRQGLSYNGVTTIFQDRDGYMWFGTHYGLNRYDGLNIKTYFSGNSKNTLSENTINSIVQDAAGNLWIATEVGISVFNPLTETFYNLNIYAKKNSVFSHNIKSIKVIDGQILFSCQKGLYKFNPGNGLFTDKIAQAICMKINKYKINSTINLESAKIYKKDKNDSFWLSTKNTIIVGKIINNQLVIIDTISIANPNKVEITAFFEDHFSNLWVGTENDGLYLLKEVKGKFSSIKIYPNNNTNKVFSRITEIIHDNLNNLIVASRSDGAITIPKKELVQKKFITINKIDLESQKIRSIYLSRDNTLWIGTLGNGVYFQNDSGLKFKNYHIKDESNNSIINNTRSITKDYYNRLWTGTLFEGLFIYGSNNQNLQTTLLSGKSIFALSKIDKNHMMVGSSDGLYIVTYDEANFAIKKLILNIKTKTVVFSIAKVKNQYWIGTDNGLLSFKLSPTFQIADQNSYKNGVLFPSNAITTIRVVKYDSKHNYLWIGSQTNGLIKVELNNDFSIKKVFSINSYMDNSEISNYICDIFIDIKDNYWIGTRNGLIHLQLTKNGAVSEIKNYTDKNGFPSNLIQSIEADINGNLWIGTHKGLIKFNKKSFDITSYDINDGVQDYEFSEHSSYSDTNNVFYFGGINGVSQFSTNHINYVKTSEAVYIKDVFSNGININKNRTNNKDNQLILSHFDNNIKINYISPNFTNPKNIKYKYILEGKDKEWISATPNIHTAEYLNLPNGDYKFKVKSSNEDGTWKTDYTTLNIKIKPSFWLTFPAVLIYLILLSLLVFLISTITKKQVDRKNKEILEKQYNDQMEKINTSKLEFFINISHEIRTPLTLILCSIEKLVSNFNLTPKQQKETLTIDRNVNRILELTNELLSIRKMETGNYQLKVQQSDIIQFIRNIKIAFKGLAKQKGIKISIVSDETELLMWFDRNALEKIIFNLISNGIKYSNEGGTIQIHIKTSINKNFITLNFIDNGIGIDSKHISQIFNRFYHHGGNIDRYVNGYGIGLSLTKSLVELHKGTILVKSELNKGSIFTLTLPLKEDLFTTEEKIDRAIWDDNLFSTIDSTPFDKKEIGADNIEFEDKINEEDDRPIILYVDDNVELLENMADYFSEFYKVYTAGNGEEGVKMANSISPDIIISDIVMPIMDGFELCTILKNDINTSHIPIILLTAKGDIDSQFHGIQSGADYFIPKPFNIKLLSITIKNLIDSRNKLKELFVNNKYENIEDITTNSKDKEFIEKLLKYVNENIEEESLNINNIADVFAMSRSTFFRKIKAITGTTGKEFIDSVRLKKATKLLTNSDLNISEIAYAIGHSNPQYFSKWFKSHYKISPSEYILKYKKQS